MVSLFCEAGDQQLDQQTISLGARRTANAAPSSQRADPRRPGGSRSCPLRSRAGGEVGAGSGHSGQLLAQVTCISTAHLRLWSTPSPALRGIAAHPHLVSKKGL